MYRKYFQRLRHQAFAVLFGIVLISACTVTAGAAYREVSGDGFSLYGNIYAPTLPDHPFAEHSYVYVSYTSFTGSYDIYDYIVSLTYSPVPFVYDLDSHVYTISSPDTIYTYIYCSSPSIAEQIGLLYSDDWIVVGPEYVDELAFSSGWSNFDIYDTSGALHYESQPFYPLDGLRGYLSDGHSDLGKTVISSYFDPPSVAVASDLYLPSFYGRYTSNVTIYSNYWSIRYFIALVTGRPDTDTVSMSDIDDTHFCNFFAYEPVSSGGIDFSQTTLTASNPQYDYQSAEFDISWSNLPEVPYPDNVQYFIQGRLNDGAASQPPEIYLGSSSDPPTSDIPVSFSFSGLQPETQYTATFELVYNTTGSFRDFTRSGVTTTVSFTTLSDGSISEGDKAIINAIQQGNKDNQQWTDSQFGSAVGDLPQDTTETDSLISGLDEQEEAFKDDAYDRFQELSSAFSGFDGSVGSGIGLAGTLFTRFYRALGSYQIIYTFPLLLGLAMVLIGRLGRSSIHVEREPGDQFKIDGW